MIFQFLGPPGRSFCPDWREWRTMKSCRKRLSVCLTLPVLWCSVAPLIAQVPEPVFLWSLGAPGSEGKTAPEAVRLSDDGEHIVSSIHHPSILPYLPAKGTATGAGVLVIPGGGHRELWMDHEGYNVASWLSHHGVAAFVLKYRLASEPGSTYTVEGVEQSDAQRALRLIRSRAAEWGSTRIVLASWASPPEES